MPSPETITGGLAILGTPSQVGPYYQVIGGLAIEFGRQTPLETQIGGLGIEGYALLVAQKDTITGGLAIEGFGYVTQFPTEAITGGLAIETSLILKTNIVVGSSQPIADSTPSGVLPMIGSAIFTRWVPTLIKDVRVTTHEDLHESSGLDDDATRHRWELAINVPRTDIATHWNFIKNHYGNGKAFYFYDLQSNGFQYDGTGVLTSGRYMVRFDTAPIIQVLQLGQRYVIEYSVLEVQ